MTRGAGPAGDRDGREIAVAPTSWLTRPRIIELGEAEMLLVWWGPAQVALSLLLTGAAIVSLVLGATQLATGQMPWQTAIVVGAIAVAAAVGAGWLFRHREVRLRLDSAGLSHGNRLGGFSVPWDQVRRVELVGGRGGQLVQVVAARSLGSSGRRRRDILVDESLVPVIATAVEHWTGRPLLVRLAGTTVAWRTEQGSPHLGAVDTGDLPASDLPPTPEEPGTDTAPDRRPPADGETTR